MSLLIIKSLPNRLLDVLGIATKQKFKVFSSFSNKYSVAFHLTSWPPKVKTMSEKLRRYKESVSARQYTSPLEPGTSFPYHLHWISKVLHVDYILLTTYSWSYGDRIEDDAPESMIISCMTFPPSSCTIFYPTLTLPKLLLKISVSRLL